jgi:hypothetical protein
MLITVVKYVNIDNTGFCYFYATKKDAEKAKSKDKTIKVTVKLEGTYEE